MESLLSTYASSDEEDDHPQPTTTTTTTITNPSPSSSSLFSSLPKPQSFSSSSSSSIFSSKEEEDLKPPSKPSSFFSSLPVPKSQPTKTTPDFSLPPPIPKRVVQFHPPLPHPLSNNPKNLDKDDEEDEEEKQRKKKRQLGHDTSVKSFLSSMPTPKNSLGSSLGGGSTSSGSGRRSIVETEGSVLSNDGKCEVGIEYNVENGEENWSNESNSQNYEAGIDQNYVGYEGYGGGYDSYGSYGQYEASWSAPESSVQVESFVNMGGGKRRKDQVPVEILEVKQDELMKDRPREDKSRLTGIAFGPSYQPTSTKGKPSKLHKRKHQIGSLYFDMKQKEMELAERRSKGLLTKAETQAKYGW